MASRIKRYTVLGLGWIFVLLGLAGLVLPVLQGILFLMIGFVLLSKESVWAKRQLERLKTKYPALGAKYDEAEMRAKRLWERIMDGVRKRCE